MMRSLYAGVSGLQAHQTKMDVVGNNIANVNTTGFKKGQVTFQDMLSQTLSDAQAGNASAGGVNAQQIGTGVRVGAVTNIHTQGASSTTGNPTDLMIQGEGYFILDSGGNKYYSRAGAFSMDNNGNLVNSANGMRVCNNSGTPITINGSNINVGPDGTIYYVDNNGAAQTYASKIGVATFPNAQGLKKVGENMYVESAASGVPSNTPNTPGVGGRGTLVVGALEMANVDLAQEFVDMIITERGFQANSRTIRTADEMLQELINIKR